MADAWWKWRGEGGHRVEPRIALPSLATIEANAARIADWIDAQSEEQMVVLSLSKGSSQDFMAAISQTDGRQFKSKVVAWVSLSGVLQGTPLVQWLRHSRGAG